MTLNGTNFCPPQGSVETLGTLTRRACPLSSYAPTCAALTGLRLLFWIQFWTFRFITAGFQKFNLEKWVSPWEIWTCKGHSEVNISNDFGLCDPQSEALQIEFASARYGPGPKCESANTANLHTTILDFRGFDSRTILNLRGGIPMSIGNSESTNLSRDNLSREIGRTSSPEPALVARRLAPRSRSWSRGRGPRLSLTSFYCYAYTYYYFFFYLFLVFFYLGVFLS